MGYCEKHGKYLTDTCLSCSLEEGLIQGVIDTGMELLHTPPDVCAKHGKIMGSVCYHCMCENIEAVRARLTAVEAERDEALKKAEIGELKAADMFETSHEFMFENNKLYERISSLEKERDAYKRDLVEARRVATVLCDRLSNFIATSYDRSMIIDYRKEMDLVKSWKEKP